MISKPLDQVLRNSFLMATHLKHEMVTLEHLLHAIAKEPAGTRILKSCGLDMKMLESDLQDYYKRIPHRHDESTDPIHTVGFRRTLQRALIHSRSAEQEETGIGDLLVSMFAEEESHAIYFLEKQEVTRLDVLNYVAHRITKPGFEQYGEEDDEEPDRDRDEPGNAFGEEPGDNGSPEEFDEMDASGDYDEEGDPDDEHGEDVFGIPDEPDEENKRYHSRPSKPGSEREPGQQPGTRKQRSKTDLLELYTEEWTARAREGQFDRVIGRDLEIERSIEILCRRQKNNPIYVGD
ncbi:MAG: Clp protease N-terminal domain-containing protein, partial [Bacteroidota bacterium]